MLSVGETLKRARQSQSLDLATLAARTKISEKYLAAIESDDRSDFPSGFFYKSFVDQYAKFLALDTREIDAEVDRILSADAPLPLPGYESAVARSVSPLTAGSRFHFRRALGMAATLVIVVGGCSGFYTWWRTWKTAHAGAKVELASPKTVTRAAPAPQVEKSAEEIAPAAPTAKAPKSVQAVQQEDAAAPSAATEAASAAEPSSPDYKVMLDLLAREATWLSVSSDGKPVFSGILKANESKIVSGKQFAKMRVGNAAGIEVRLNGKLLGPLGARGQVLVVLFTPDRFEIVQTPRESD
jgi:cytoskeleton protein RodZ